MSGRPRISSGSFPQKAGLCRVNCDGWSPYCTDVLWFHSRLKQHKIYSGFGIEISSKVNCHATYTDHHKVFKHSDQTLAGAHRLSTGNIVNPPKQPIFISDIWCAWSGMSDAGHKPAAAADALSTPYINCFDSSWPRVKIHRPFHCFLAIASLYSHAIQNNSAVCVSAWTGIAQRQ